MSDLRWLREHYKVSVSEMAGELNMTADEYQKFEAETGMSRLDRIPAAYKKALVAAAAVVVGGSRQNRLT